MALRRNRVLIKRYSNRRLYDTEKSQYITLEDLAQRIRKGSDVQVIDAKSNEDLTQQTLTQVIMESRGAARLLPVPLLTQLIRMGDEALGEFFGRTMSWALEVYLGAQHTARAVSPYNPFASLPFSATSALARLLTSSGMPWSDPGGASIVMDAPPHAPGSEPEPPSDVDAEVADLRREVEELKQAMRESKKR
jgi:polyhydroxyalkanoate synthesis repressor PhaR